MTKYLAFIIGLLTFAQNPVKISGKIILNSNKPISTIMLYGYGDDEKKITQTEAKKNGANEFTFELNVPANSPTGVYRLFYDTENYGFVDIILDNEPEIVFELKQDPYKLTFSKSKNNAIWYEKRIAWDEEFMAINYMENFVERYPKKQDKIYIAVNAELIKRKTAFKKERTDFLNKNENTWYGLMLKNVPYRFSEDMKERESYWTGVNTHDVNLLRTPLFSDLIVGYVQDFLRNSAQMKEDERKEQLKKVTDDLIKEFSAQPEIKSFVANFLIKGFTSMGLEDLVQYIDEKHLTADQCTNDKQKEEYEKRMAGYKLMKVGNSVPEITGLTKDDKTFNLSNLKGKKTLVVFWANWCPHCAQEIPKLYDAVKNNSQIQVVAIALDVSEQDFERSKEKYKEFYHYCDFKKWNSKPAQDYFISSTPTFILLDENHKILGKYASTQQFLKELQNP